MLVNIYEYQNKVYEGKNEIKLELNSMLGTEFYLDIRYPSKDADELIYYPTERTEELLARWELVAELFPEIDYPESAVSEEEWGMMRDVMHENKPKMEDIVRERFPNTESYGDDYVSPYSLEEYIYEGWIHTHVGDELGIEDPKFYNK
jgi:hypothetical protein